MTEHVDLDAINDVLCEAEMEIAHLKDQLAAEHQRAAALEALVAAMLKLIRRIASIDPRVTTTVYNWCHYCDGREYPNEVPARPLEHRPDCPWVAAQATVALTDAEHERDAALAQVERLASGVNEIFSVLVEGMKLNRAGRYQMYERAINIALELRDSAADRADAGKG